MNINIINERFSQLRKHSGFTQKQIADYLGVDQSYISKCEKNERQFSSDILEKAAVLFGCTMDCFVNEASEFKAMPIALRAKALTPDDLDTLAAINTIALNLRFMEGLLGEE